MHKNFLQTFFVFIFSISAFYYCSADNFGSNNYGSSIYSASAPTVTASPSSGTYTSYQTVSLSTQNGNTIRYSYSNDLSSCTGGSLYSLPLSVNSSKTIYALACDSYGNSTSGSFAYIINIQNSSSSGGGGGGGSGSYSSNTSTKNTNIVNNTTDTKVAPITINRVLRLKMKGDDVKVLQTYLKSKGYYLGIVDGSFGLKTRQAVLDFQKAKGLTPDGIVGPKTVLFINQKSETNNINNDTKINSSVSKARIIKLLKPIMKGDDVKVLQTYLKSKGYYLGIVDGSFGLKTRQAVLDFQKAKGLTPDGIVGPKTLYYISSQP